MAKFCDDDCAVGLTYKKEYKNETWFIVQVLMQQVSGGWSSLIYRYKQ